ncbi:MAG: DUF1573 domain-containing protein [Planctomycetales bacterium]|nr:DUF1573 domain-containing protein [Planctomycetales bacterium]
MFRNLVIAPLLVCLLTHAAYAQSWATKMFQTTTHDFGTVARAAKSDYVFEIQNIFKETVHISGVRASCGCAIPSVVKPTLATWEKGGILVEFNTRAFLGQRKATITVTIDQPYYTEVQLTITGFIRGDIVIDPGTVKFDGIEQGDEATQTVNVSYAGRTDWQIVDVRSANQNLIVEPTEMQRANGRVDYQLKVHLRPDAPSGYFNDQMVLVTNDYQQQQIPLRVEGHVVAPLSVSPSTLNLGVIQPGQSITRKLVVKGKKPFRVTDIKCGDANFAFEPTDEEKVLHIIPITFTAGAEPAQISQEITVETDLNGGSTGAVLATATVRDLES